jgi:subtilisin family serine protease
MRNVILILTALILSAGCVETETPSNGTDPDFTELENTDPQAPERRMVVLLAPGQDGAQLENHVVSYFGQTATVEPLFPGIDDEELSNMYLVITPARNPDLSAWDAAYDFQAAGNYERVEPDQSDTLNKQTEHASATGACIFDGNDSNPDHAWSLRNIKAEEAWQLVPAGNGKQFGEDIKICHPDTGWSEHDDMDSMDLSLAWNVIENSANAQDPFNDGFMLNPGHGTATGSVIASRGGIAPGSGTTPPGLITGVAPGADLVPIRTVNSVVQVFDSDVAQAVAHSVNAQCDVISMSLGGRAFFGLKSAVRYAVKNGLIVVAAAGNCVGMVVAPAMYKETIAVAATNDMDIPWKGSSRGRTVTISAPGENVWVAVKRNAGHSPQNISTGNGTSFGAAEVAASAALWLAFHGRGEVQQAAGSGTVSDLFVDVLQNSARTPPGWNKQKYGSGILDVEALLSAPLQPMAPATPMSAAAAVSESITMLARLTDRDTGEIEQAMRVILKNPPDLDSAVARWAPEFMDIALNDPVAFQAALDAALAEPGVPGSDSPGLQAGLKIDDLLSDTLRSAIQ